MDNFGEMIVAIGSWASIILPILTVAAIIIPKMRKAIGKWCNKAFGIAEINANIKEMQNQIKNIQEYILDHKNIETRNIKNQIATAKDNLMRAFYFYIDRGYITLEELDVLQEVYDSYHEIGGNGIITKRWENEICKLPNRPQKKKGE